MHALTVFRSPVWLLLHKLSSPHYRYIRKMRRGDRLPLTQHILINVYWNKYGLIQTDATNDIVVYSFLAWLITESKWFDRCIISKMILKSGSNWLLPVVFSVEITLTGSHSGNSFEFSHRLTVFISNQISLIFLLFLIPYIIIIIRANGPRFALCHAWPSRCEIIYWF
jgi:hypothetical protein